MSSWISPLDLALETGEGLAGAVGRALRARGALAALGEVHVVRRLDEGVARFSEGPPDPAPRMADLARRALSLSLDDPFEAENPLVELDAAASESEARRAMLFEADELLSVAALAALFGRPPRSTLHRDAADLGRRLWLRSARIVHARLRSLVEREDADRAVLSDPWSHGLWMPPDDPSPRWRPGRGPRLLVAPATELAELEDDEIALAARRFDPETDAFERTIAELADGGSPHGATDFLPRGPDLPRVVGVRVGPDSAIVVTGATVTTVLRDGVALDPVRLRRGTGVLHPWPADRIDAPIDLDLEAGPRRWRLRLVSGR